MNGNPRWACVSKKIGQKIEKEIKFLRYHVFHQPDLLALTARVQSGDNYGITDRRSGVEKVVIKIIAHVLTSLFFKINSLYTSSPSQYHKERGCVCERCTMFL